MHKTRLLELLNDEEGASAIEYALMASMVAVALVALIPQIRTAVVAIFNNILTALTK